MPFHQHIIKRILFLCQSHWSFLNGTYPFGSSYPGIAFRIKSNIVYLIIQKPPSAKTEGMAAIRMVPDYPDICTYPHTSIRRTLHSFDIDGWNALFGQEKFVFFTIF